eukprot:TRINITY_DN66082_c0_g1_i1.p1 TRINITY_DN66082_c0_g1~~TRINITY_DN66082_c0_g1_i1.p1  ORF type:complete len:130 (-),score=25.89 TRINITY_DN66082_c0_g1_i1:37-387(-)
MLRSLVGSEMCIRDSSITPRSKMSLAFGTHVVPLDGDFFAVTDYDSLDTEMFEWRGDSKTVRRCWVKKGCLPSRVGSEHFSMIQLKRNLLEVRKLENGEAVPVSYTHLTLPTKRIV